MPAQCSADRASQRALMPRSVWACRMSDVGCLLHGYALFLPRSPCEVTWRTASETAGQSGAPSGYTQLRTGSVALAYCHFRSWALAV